jgi:hypothetical protein
VTAALSFNALRNELAERQIVACPAPAIIRRQQLNIAPGDMLLAIGSGLTGTKIAAQGAENGIWLRESDEKCAKCSGLLALWYRLDELGTAAQVFESVIASDIVKQPRIRNGVCFWILVVVGLQRQRASHFV